MLKISEIADKALQNNAQLFNFSNDLLVTSFDHDSRRISKGGLYVAIKGANQDGHAFIKDAKNAGAVACLVRTPDPDVKIVQIVVKDTVYSYGEIARYWRKKINYPVVAITGSNGKTTVKELVLTILAGEGPSVGTKGNFNNLIGVPYTLLSFPQEAKFGVLELGMNAKDEIYRLAQISDPNFAVVTNVAKAHIGLLGSMEAVFNAKMELFDYMLENQRAQGTVVMNISDPMIKNWEHREKLRKLVTYSCLGNVPADIRFLSEDNDGKKFKLLIDGIQTLEGATELKGHYNLCNICCAVAVTMAMGVDPVKALERIKNIKLPEMRSQLKQKAGIIYFLDCYNANPDSMLAGMIAAARTPNTLRRIAVVGDMLELGDFSDGLHYEAGKQLVEHGYEHVFAIGDYAKDYMDGYIKNSTNVESKANVHTYAAGDHSKLKSDLKAFLREGDLVFVKASRGIKLELAVDL